MVAASLEGILPMESRSSEFGNAPVEHTACLPCDQHGRDVYPQGDVDCAGKSQRLDSEVRMIMQHAPLRSSDLEGQKQRTDLAFVQKSAQRTQPELIARMSEPPY